MLCPEGVQVYNENVDKLDESHDMSKKVEPTEIRDSMEINSFKNLKTWKKSITNFFRNQIRSSRSNDGDRPSDNNDDFEEKEVSPEQKWQSLGKIFRRQSFVGHCNRSENQGESSHPNKRLAVRKVLSSYFGKGQNISTNEQLK